MNAIDFIRGTRFGIMVATMLMNENDLLKEKEVIEMLRYKTKTIFLRELVLCENPKLKPVIFGKTSKRLYRRSDVRELVNGSQLTYDYAEAQKYKHSIFQ